MVGSPVIVDASFALKLLLPNPQQEQCRVWMAYLVAEKTKLVAPTLWVYETVSSLCKVVRFGQVTLDEGQRFLDQLEALDIQLFPPHALLNRRAFEWTLQLGRGASYDSYYLALAETLNGHLVTADHRLVNAVDLAWIHWVGGPVGL